MTADRALLVLCALWAASCHTARTGCAFCEPLETGFADTEFAVSGSGAEGVQSWGDVSLTSERVELSYVTDDGMEVAATFVVTEVWTENPEPAGGLGWP